MTDLVTYETHDDIAVVTIDNPPLNVISPGVPEGILAGLARADANSAVRAVVLRGAGRGFMAGADIKTFTMPRNEAPDVRGLVAGAAATNKPVVAALHGVALGGGLELALACDYRVAASGARLGLPEVKIGLLPGAGGTQRLPRLVGLEGALELIVSGTPVGAERALELGLVDKIIEGDLLDGALTYAREVADAGKHPTSEREVSSATPIDTVLAAARRQAETRARGLVAPQRCIDAVEAAAKLPFDAGMARERELFIELLEGAQSRGLRHVFFAERQAAKVEKVDDSVRPKEIQQGAVVGAGTMGGGIAMCFANAGIPVKVLEVSQENLDRGLGVVEKNYQRTVEKGRLSEDEMTTRMNRIEGTLNAADLADADVVIEAVFEDMSIKKEMFTQLDRVAGTSAVLATNTSTLDVNEIAAVTARPEAVVGMHFFSPANVMKLLEVVRADETSDEALLTAVTLGKKMGKVPVVVGVCDGFVGNRMLHPYLLEAQFLLEEGALPQQIDRVMTDFGMAMGPFAVSDLAGLDVGYRIRQARAATRDPAERYSALADKLVEMDRLGQKSGAGFYRYEPGDRTPHPDPAVEHLILEHARDLGLERREITDEEILKRLVYQLVNEGAQVLDEGIAQRSSDIDVIYVYGYGFPAYRGGPMFYAGELGLDAVYADVVQFRERYGDQWQATPLLQRLAEAGQTFADFDREKAA